MFETDPAILNGLSSELYGTVINFQGSFNRESPTSQDGTTPGALLWDQWHRGEYGCEFGETPVSCELRIHKPSFVIIQIGTHFESRNTEYLRTIINQLLDAGVVPILGTKADNRELDNRVNRDLTMLATEYDLPLWNFWAALSDLPDRGLYVMDGREDQGAIYLNEEASTIHRMTGLEMLNDVWRAATGTIKKWTTHAVVHFSLSTQFERGEPRPDLMRRACIVHKHLHIHPIAIQHIHRRLKGRILDLLHISGGAYTESRASSSDILAALISALAHEALIRSVIFLMASSMDISSSCSPLVA